MTSRVLAAVALAVGVAAGPVGAQGVDPASFQARTVADMAALCGVAANDRNAAAAIHFCHGYLTGVGQYHAALYPASAPRRVYCPPAQGPTLDEATASFVAWARANPQLAGERAIDGIARWAQATYPCPAAPAARR
jgi:hypothetical protein